MTDVDRLLRTYIERFESGESVDPTDLLEQAEGADRARLQTMIEGYLEHGAPRREWDADAFEGSVAEKSVARLSESWSDASGELPSTLAALRKKGKIKREELIGQLADALGVQAKREKVAYYYHQLEWGLLPSEGVSSKVYDALACLLDTSADELRRAGSTPTPGTEPADAIPSFARTARPDPAYGFETSMDAPGAPSPGTVPERDEVDRLFTEGD